MHIDRYIHDERLTWGAAGVLMLVTAIHAAGIGKLFTTQPEIEREPQAPVFQVSLQKLPPPRLPEEIQPDRSDAPTQPEQRPRQTRPVPILVDTPTTDPVPPDTQVKKYEIGDELLPGEPGPPMPEGAGDAEGTGAAVDDTPVVWKMKLVDMKPPVYPPRCLRMGIEGIVRLRILVGEDGRPQEVTLAKSSGDAGLDQSAIDAARGWRFEPARRNGEPVRAWATVPVEFKLID